MLGTPSVGNNQSIIQKLHTVTKIQLIVNLISKRTELGCTNPTYFHYARHRHYDHQFYQARCIRAKLCQAQSAAQKLCQNPCNNNVSKNETKEEQDSTGISPRDYILVSSFHLPPGFLVLEHRPVGRCWNTGPLPSRVPSSVRRGLSPLHFSRPTVQQRPVSQAAVPHRPFKTLLCCRPWLSGDPSGCPRRRLGCHGRREGRGGTRARARAGRPTPAAR